MKISDDEKHVNLYVTILSDSAKRWEVWTSDDGKVDFIFNMEGALRMIELIQHCIELQKRRELTHENQ